MTPSSIVSPCIKPEIRKSTIHYFMKQKFDNAGVDYVQKETLALPPPVRETRCNLIRADLHAALDQLFALHPNQQAQLSLMPTDLKAKLGAAIARTWEAGDKVVFDKETKDEDDLPDKKILEVFGIDDDPAPQSLLSIVPVMIRIRYRYPL